MLTSFVSLLLAAVAVSGPMQLASEPSWSPDSMSVVFAAGKFPKGREIYTIAADGSSLKQLTYNSAPDEYPMWSPDGKQILFSSNREGDWRLYVMNSDGSAQLSTGIVTSAEAEDACRAAWSPDSKRIVYPVTKDGRRELFVADANGAKATRLTNINGIYPRWSPDGGFIAFCNVDERNLYMIDADSANPRRVTEKNERPRSASYPSWAANGNRLVYIERGDEKQSDVFSIALDSSDKRRITNVAGSKFYAIASPDGTRVAYVTYDPERKTDEISIVNMDGSGARLLVEK